LKNGTVLIGSDFHIWPGEESTCLRAFKKFVDDIKPSAIILNGDVMDFPRISRHPQNWEKAPDPQEEIESVQDHLNDIVHRSKRGSKKIWNLGNHDARLESLIANSTPQLRGMRGVHLADHFSGVWQRAMSCFINEGVDGGETMVKHIPPGGGANATRNYIVKAGTHVVHGHLHRQSVQCVSNYRRYNLYGVDAGMVADKQHMAFGYTQDNPNDWRSGFSLLTFLDGILMPPDLITKISEKSVYFRGETIRV
jgi:3',5'-cyclic AMP phosphodiesterase CpdA